MSSNQYVFGHQNPDTDSVCSAIVYANYLGATPILLGTTNNEAVFALEQAGVAQPEIHTTLPEGSTIHLVDHNEASQSILNRDHHTTASVIDHHKIGNLATNTPLMMRIDPVGCTCTILFEYFIQQGYNIPTTDATLMISAIISDTLFLNGPTTTQRDRDALEGLYSISSLPSKGISLEEYASLQFSAKSSLEGMSAHDIVTSDLKSFEVEGSCIAIGVFETTDPTPSLQMKEQLLQSIATVKDELGANVLFFCIVDILKSTNTALILGEAEEQMIKGAFDVDTHDSVADLGSRISRKKQIVPDITTYFLK